MARLLRLVELSGATRTMAVDAVALASGADGAVHIIAGEPTLIAKLYHDPGKDPERLTKLRAMLADPPNLGAIEANGRRYVQIAWPVGWLEDETDNFIGYVMPAVDLSRATALENFLAKKTRAMAGLPESYGYRLTAAANLAAVVTELHAHGHHIIDLKPVNMNVYTDTFFMAVLDCDGFSVRGEAGVRFPAHQFSDGYICPEALQQSLPPQVLGEDQDRFALAVILFQLLNQGLHPYQGVPGKGALIPPSNGEKVAQELYAYGKIANPMLQPSPWSIHEFFDDETRTLFDRAFTTHHDRPAALEWADHLHAYADITSGKVHVCVNDSEHVHFSKGCPWCALAARVIPGVQAAHAGKVGKKGKKARKKKGKANPAGVVMPPNTPVNSPAAARTATVATAATAATATASAATSGANVWKRNSATSPGAVMSTFIAAVGLGITSFFLPDLATDPVPAPAPEFQPRPPDVSLRSDRVPEPGDAVPVVSLQPGWVPAPGDAAVPEDSLAVTELSDRPMSEPTVVMPPPQAVRCEKRCSSGSAAPPRHRHHATAIPLVRRGLRHRLLAFCRRRSLGLQGGGEEYRDDRTRRGPRNRAVPA